MASSQFSVRIPPSLEAQLKEYAAKNGTTKTEVMVAALARYLDCATEIPLVQRVVELEERLEALEDNFDALIAVIEKLQGVRRGT